mmetsp:Transcript_73527/g.117201  ORF Transcript_73527/g.117201 Transcript_73527/m.117201 type:complete len:212 (+) Transcript_73527:382-1017(+)
MQRHDHLLSAALLRSLSTLPRHCEIGTQQLEPLHLQCVYQHRVQRHPAKQSHSLLRSTAAQLPNGRRQRQAPVHQCHASALQCSDTHHSSVECAHHTLAHHRHTDLSSQQHAIGVHRITELQSIHAISNLVAGAHQEANVSRSSIASTHTISHAAPYETYVSYIATNVSYVSYTTSHETCVSYTTTYVFVSYAAADHMEQHRCSHHIWMVH